MYATRAVMLATEDRATITLNTTGTATTGPTTYRVEGNAIGVVGDTIILNFNTYHPDQGWLPFMKGTILAHAPPEEQSTPDARRFSDNIITRRLDQWERNRMMRTNQSDSLLRPTDTYPYEWRTQADRDQHVLPFHEFRRVRDRGEFDAASKVWERRDPTEEELVDPSVSLRISGREDDPTLYSYVFGELNDDLILWWLHRHMIGRYFFDQTGRGQSRRATFACHADWMHVRLRFHPDMDPDSLREP